MELTETVTPSIERWDGVELITLVGGQKLKVQTTGDGGGQLLDITVPDGKKWVGSVRVQFVEETA